MSNFEYKNIDEIISTNKPIRGSRIEQTNGRKIIVPKFEPLTSQDVQVGSGGESVELHVFLPNSAYITTLYDVNTWKIESDNNNPPKKTVSLDVHRDLGKNGLNLTPGNYKIVYNFFRNLIGGAQSKTKLFISDISTDRKELKLSLTNPSDESSLLQLKTFVLEYLKPKKYLPPIILNFGENKIVDVINVTSDGSTTHFFVKLLEELPADLDLYYECWVGSQILKPYIDSVTVIPQEEKSDIPYISGPNFEVDYDYWVTSETDYKSWNDILATNTQTSQEILNRYISGSNQSVQLNVNFREFENFIFYSSAEERFENFFYKVKLIEHYDEQLALVNTYTGSLVSNKIRIQSLKDKVITGFDNFEKWLYYETTGSNYYTSQTSASITPYPKYSVSGNDYTIATKEGKYKLYGTISNQTENWYTDIVEKARSYDLKNYNSLNKAIPDYLREDSDNEQFVTFVNMVGQHFDVLYLYTDHILKKNLREEHPKDGLSQDLIYDATKNLGWTLSHGTQAKDLWEYALGVSGSGEPIWTGKTTTNKYLAKTYEEKTKEVWRRILNNLPYIYKTKGTARGIKALLSAYGIPQTLLTIREYGGPDNADLGIIPRNEWEKQTYFFNFFGSLPLPTTNRYIYVPWEQVNNTTGSWQYPDTVTFRWKMEPEFSYKYTGNAKQTLLQKQSGSRVDWFVTMDKNASTDEGKGTVTFWLGNGTTYASASIYDDYFYDDVPLNLMIQREYSNDATSSNQIYRFFVKTAKYGKLVIERSGSIVVSGSSSGSYNRAWSSNGTLYIGSGSNPQTTNILSGSVFELRYWSNQLNESSFNNHVLAPRSYNGNSSTSSFYDLQGQWKFWQKFDVAATSSLRSSHPNQKKSTFLSSSKNAVFYNFTSESFESITETYNMEVATVGNNTPFAEKVRIDSGSLIGGLDPLLSSEVSQFDKFSVDSNKLMVAFSPQSIINEDIYEAIGYTTIDDYFGEYSNIDKEEYPRLKWFAREYWQKYPNKNDFTAYINLLSEYDFSVFDQIRQTLPARVNEILGLVIEPNILERSKVKVLRNFSGESGNTQRTNEISSSAVPSVSISSKKATILIGFENESSYQEIDGETDIPLEIDAAQDINVSGDYDTKIVGIGYAKKYQMTISNSRGHFGNFIRNNYKPYKTTILMNTGSLYSEYTKYYTSIQNSNFGKIIGTIASGMGTGLTTVFGTVDTAFSNTFGRENVQYSEGTPDTGYGLGWTTVTNDGGKSSALFTTYQSYRTDSYYSAYKFYYTSSADMAERNYSSYQFVSASYENPNNLTNSIRNHRFEGCKLTGPDINIDTRNTPDGKPVVEVFIVDPNQINTNQNFTNSGI